MVTIKTHRILLRELKETDCQAVLEYASDPEVVRYMDWGPNSKEETEAFINRSLDAQNERPRLHYTLAITLIDNKKLIGSCGISVSNPDNREGWIGYCLNKLFWNKGYATETARALLDFGFSELNLHRIFATCDPANLASARVLEKIGMKREGHLRQHKWAKGKWRDSYLYAIVHPE
jgi:ribosomal-protein-alanine N-acetyltransferase